MKSVALTLLVAVAVFTSSRPLPQSRTTPAPTVPVVVELFTSEGCSSCPAADAALRELEATQPLPGIELLVLGQHVDYWNRLGWHDPFSAPAFTRRQRQYAAAFNTNSYTPQAVVNGTYELVGSRGQHLRETIAQAAKAPRATVWLSCPAPGTLAVRVGNLPTGTGAAEVLLALTETGLASQVGRGENAGHLLRHAAVVRELRTLGTVGPGGTFCGTTPLARPAAWQTANLRAVVLVQETASRRLVGAAGLPLHQPVRSLSGN